MLADWMSAVIPHLRPPKACYQYECPGVLSICRGLQFESFMII